VAEKDEETNKFRRSVKKIGIDPHHSYANALCDVAWARSWGTGSFMMPDTPTPSALAQRVTEAMPGIPENIVRMLDDVPAGTCGRCVSFADGHCSARGLSTRAVDPGCIMLEAREG
jgi:hypothetical protein